ncbi:MAG: SGNH/GDSL hydrolase family protein [Bacteroidaceae bacterium]|nr:SGNH/GDSL hydrolase family protein [Bacteroidaceae bacterium]
MKTKGLSFLVLMVWAVVASAQTPKDVKYTFTEAADLTLIGRLFSDNPIPYHRVDTSRFHGFTSGENFQVRQSAGIACVFRTNSTVISVQTQYGQLSFPANTMGLAARGYDLYIRKDGRWIYAASGVMGDKSLDGNLVLIRDMDGKEKECMLYLPMYSEVKSLKIGVQEGATIEPMDNPFRHRIVFFGSSFTHGVSTSRTGMSYPLQLERATGLHVVSLGCSGNCKLQPYFCDVLCAAQADAFVFDTFSNPSIPEIEQRLFPFIEKLQKAHPGVPLIFQRTIYRERRNFNTAVEKFERARQERVGELMKEACKRYKDVYYVTVTNATSPTHETSVDGTHPGDYGYTLWAESLRKPLVKILKKYGIR